MSAQVLRMRAQVLPKNEELMMLLQYGLHIWNQELGTKLIISMS